MIETMMHDIGNYFTSHPPTAQQTESMVEIMEQARGFATRILNLTPASNEQFVAIQKIREVVFWANAAIACHE